MCYELFCGRTFPETGGVNSKQLTIDTGTPWPNLGAWPECLGWSGPGRGITSRPAATNSTVYRDERNRRHFLELLATWIQRFRVRLHAYVLMGNHYHLLAETSEANLSRAMRLVGRLSTDKALAATVKQARSELFAPAA